MAPTSSHRRYRRLALSTSTSVQIRPAASTDVELIYALIRQLAEYERAPEQVRGTPELLAEALFGEHPTAEALIAERDGAPVGFALFYGTFSTWECRPGLWLEDLYVPPEQRRGGVGRALLSELAAIAVDRGCSRLEWAALDWNEPALDFYEKLSAKRLDDWVIHRLDGTLLEAMAAGAGGGRTLGPDPDG
jgi:GNAT superfamily N-acetyltransferase